jgi:manganese/zinc/iron transport system permease protein
VQVMAGCALVVCAASVALFKEFKLLCFDPGYASGIGFPTAVLDGLLMLLIVLAVVIGLQAVGVVLMAALLITPAAAARLWTDRLNVMVFLAGLFGALSGALGTLISAGYPRMPTGPLIVLAATIVFILSLVFAPRRGLLARAWRLLVLRATVGRENALRSLYEVAETAQDWSLAVTPEQLAAHRGQAAHLLAAELARLRREGLVQEERGRFSLTELGLSAAYQVVRNHRLWEMFLMHEGQLGADHVDRDADFIEHHLTRDTVEELERLLRVHGRAPELPPSVHPVRG